MADINLEKKQGGSMVWLWVLIAIVILALVAWWLMREPDVVEPLETTTSPTTFTELAAPPHVPVIPVAAGERLELPA